MCPVTLTKYLEHCLFMGNISSSCSFGYVYADNKVFFVIFDSNENLNTILLIEVRGERVSCLS